MLNSMMIDLSEKTSSKVKISKFQPQKLPIGISEKNETKVMH